MRWNLGDRRDRAKDLFLRAQGDFIDPLGCREEAMGVTSDIFLAHLRDREFLLDHLEKMHSAFQELINGAKLRAAWAAFNAVKKAAKSGFSWETEELRRAITALRDSVSHAPGVLRCILRVR